MAPVTEEEPSGFGRVQNHQAATLAQMHLRHPCAVLAEPPAVGLLVTAAVPVEAVRAITLPGVHMVGCALTVDDLGATVGLQGDLVTLGHRIGDGQPDPPDLRPGTSA